MNLYTSSSVSLLLLMCIIHVRDVTMCSTDYTCNPNYPTRCYKVYTSEMKIDDAARECKNEDAFLLMVESPTTNSFVQTLMYDSGASVFHLGLDDRENEGTYVWQLTGQTMSWSNWKDGTNRNNNGHDCVELSKSNDWAWTVSNCNNKKSYICDCSDPNNLEAPSSSVVTSSQLFSSEQSSDVVSESSSVMEDSTQHLASILSISPSTVPLSTNIPSTVPLSTDIPSTVPLSTDSPSAVPLSTDSPSTVPLSTDSPSTIPLSTDSPSTVPLSTDSPSTVPLSTDIPSTVPLSTDSPSTIPLSTDSPSTVPLSTDSPSTIPLSTDSPSTVPLSTDSPSAVPLSTDIPSTVPLSTDIPSTVPLSTDSPSTVPLSTDSPSTVPLSTDIPSTVPLSTNIPSAVPLSTDIPSTVPLSTNILSNESLIMEHSIQPTTHIPSESTMLSDSVQTNIASEYSTMLSNSIETNIESEYSIMLSDSIETHIVLQSSMLSDSMEFESSITLLDSIETFIVSEDSVMLSDTIETFIVSEDSIMISDTIETFGVSEDSIMLSDTIETNTASEYSPGSTHTTTNLVEEINSTGVHLSSYNVLESSSILYSPESTVSSTVVKTTTVSPKDCTRCKCPQKQDGFFANQSLEEVVVYLQEMMTATVQRKRTNSKTSITDPRTSSTVIGSGAVAIATIILSLIVLIDLPNLFKMTKIMKKNITYNKINA